MFRPFIGFLVLIIPTLQSCSSSKEPVVCTDIFKMINVTVLNQNGEPADSVQINVMDKKSGERYEICGGSLSGTCPELRPGRYVIMHDGLRRQLQTKRKNIIVEGTKGNYQFKAEYSIIPTECHVQKIAGPDTLTLN